LPFSSPLTSAPPPAVPSFPTRRSSDLSLVCGHCILSSAGTPLLLLLYVLPVEGSAPTLHRLDSFRDVSAVHWCLLLDSPTRAQRRSHQCRGNCVADRDGKHLRIRRSSLRSQSQAVPAGVGIHERRVP